MGTFWHVMKANKTQAFPRNWFFFDCESYLNEQPDGSQIHTFRLAVGHYERTARKNNPAVSEWVETKTPLELWSWILSRCEQDRKLVCVAYNLAYDARIANVFHVLKALGYDQTGVYVSGNVTILGFKRGKHKIVFIDAMNYFDGTLESWGDMLSIAKFPVDFADVTTEDLFRHCRVDVEILIALWAKWRVFCEDHDLGSFSPTKASQALQAFRHRFMSHSISIHAERAIGKLERASYYGGRVEAYHIGRPPGGRFFVYDLNSMYPYIMQTLRVPVRYLGIRRLPAIDDIKKWAYKFGYVSVVRIRTDIPAYPVRRKGRLVFPIGEFNTILAGPELNFAIENHHVVKIHRICFYETAVIFRRYVNYFYKIRQKYKLAGNEIFEQLVKYLMNCLYGKFGQYSEKWKTVENIFHTPDGVTTIMDADTGKVLKIMVLAGQRWDMLGKGESFNSFPAISAYVTSAARLYLWRLICRAGRKNVFYCDTDSLIVNSAGKRRLKEYISPDEFGKLKLEESTRVLSIYGLKDYRTDSVTKLKGIRKDAISLGDDNYSQFQWEGLRGAFAKGHLDSVLVKPITKHLVRHYTKGQVSSDGSVSPLIFRL